MLKHLDLQWTITSTTTTIIKRDRIITQIIIHKFFLRHWQRSRVICLSTAQHLERRRLVTMEIFILLQSQADILPLR